MQLPTSKFVYRGTTTVRTSLYYNERKTQLITKTQILRSPILNFVNKTRNERNVSNNMEYNL